MAEPTTIELRDYLPRLYETEDKTDFWRRFVGEVLEPAWNVLLSGREAAGEEPIRTQATLDFAGKASHRFDTVLRAVKPGEEGNGYLFTLGFRAPDGGGVTVVVVPADGTITVSAEDGASTVLQLEAAIAALAGADQIAEVATPATVNLPLSSQYDAFSSRFSGGTDESRRSIDAMADLRDPRTAPLPLLPYLAQSIGWDLDTSLPERLQRKVLTLAKALLGEKGVKQGVIDALRLLLGLECTVHELWGDAWTLEVDQLGEGTILGPAEHADAYSLGSLTGVSLSGLADHDVLRSDGWTEEFEIQKTASALGERAYGFLHAPPRGVLSNGMQLRFSNFDGGGGEFIFELRVDTGYEPSSEDVAAVDLASVPPDAASVAAKFADVIDGLLVSAGVGTAVALGQYVLIRADEPGAINNVAFSGAVVDVFEAIGMVGGAAAGAFVAAGGRHPVNLIGAASAEEVAQRVRYWLTWIDAWLVTSVFRRKVSIQKLTKGPGGDGDIEGAAAVAMSATGMTGGVGVNRAVLTFVVTPPRHLSAAEVRVAEAVLDFMKRADTHYRLANPPDPPITYWVLNCTRLGSRLGKGRVTRPAKLEGGYVGDELATRIGPTKVVALDESASARTPPLATGAKYLLSADADCYVRQGNRQVVATDSDRFLPAGRRMIVTTTATRNAYVAVLRKQAGAAAYLRVTWVDPGSC